MKQTFKVGIDIHGVIDSFPDKFMQLSRALVRDGAEVHVVTGIKRDEKVEALLSRSGIEFTHYFSIVEQLESQGEEISWQNGLPYAKDDKWNNAKRDYCSREGIAMMIDDSPVYRDTFNDIETTYLQLT